MTPPLLQRLYLRENVELPDEFPANLPFVRFLDIRFTSAMTFFVGENGSAKWAVKGTVPRR